MVIRKKFKDKIKLNFEKILYDVKKLNERLNKHLFFIFQCSVVISNRYKYFSSEIFYIS